MVKKKDRCLNMTKTAAAIENNVGEEGRQPK